MIIYLIVSILSAYGIAVSLVEKSDKWPIKSIHDKLKWLIQKLLGNNASEVLNCTVCFSFWATLISDVVLMFYSNFSYFLWPLSGFITLGLTWTIYQFIDAIESKVIRIVKEEDDD